MESRLLEDILIHGGVVLIKLVSPSVDFKGKDHSPYLGTRISSVEPSIFVSGDIIIIKVYNIGASN